MTTEKELDKIEAKHFGQCLWQERVGGTHARMIVECMQFPGAKTVAIVTKHYDGILPRAGKFKPWPKLTAVEVYVPADSTGTWTGLDESLTKLAIAASGGFQQP